jgi:hypothetical protein
MQISLRILRASGPRSGPRAHNYPVPRRHYKNTPRRQGLGFSGGGGSLGRASGGDPRGQQRCRLEAGDRRRRSTRNKRKRHSEAGGQAVTALSKWTDDGSAP